MLHFACWILDSRRWTVDTGLWMLHFACWNMDAGCWTLDAGIWMLHFGCLALDTGHCHCLFQNPVSDSVWLNYWKFTGCKSLRTSWSCLFCGDYRLWFGYFQKLYVNIKYYIITTLFFEWAKIFFFHSLCRSTCDF